MCTNFFTRVVSNFLKHPRIFVLDVERSMDNKIPLNLDAERNNMLAIH